MCGISSEQQARAGSPCVLVLVLLTIAHRRAILNMDKMICKWYSSGNSVNQCPSQERGMW